MKKVLVFGAFDGLHEGHVEFFKQAKKHGTHLTVVVGRDSTVARVKNHSPKYSEQERLEQVKKHELVDEARLGNEGNDPYNIILEIGPAVICLGYDQIHFVGKLADRLHKWGLNIEIKRMKPHKPKQYKSSLLNKKEDARS